MTAFSPGLPAGVVFDCDGILVDSEPVHERATTEWAASAGIEIWPSFFIDVLGMTARQQIALLVADTDLSLDTAYAERETHFWSLLDDLPALPGVVDLVRALHEDGCGLGVASNGTARYVAHVVAALGLADAFSVLTTAEDVLHSKPHPEPYLRSVEVLGLDPTACVAVEDSPLGALSAAHAGLNVVVVDREGVGTEEFPSSAVVVADLARAGRMLYDGDWQREADQP